MKGKKFSKNRQMARKKAHQSPESDQEHYPEKGTKEYQDYLNKLKILEEIRLKKLKALELLCKKF